MTKEDTEQTPENKPQSSINDNPDQTKTEGLEQAATPGNDPELTDPEQTIILKETEQPAIEIFAEYPQAQDINVELDRDGKRTTKKGRPAKFTPAQLEDKINEFFDLCKNNEIDTTDRNGKKITLKEALIPTYAGLAYHLGIDRHTLWLYNKSMPFYPIIKKARDYVTKEIENALINSKNNPVGKIFISKNYGYTDKQEIEVTKPLEIILTDYRGRKAQEIKPISETNE
jgi:hypothetical protein